MTAGSHLRVLAIGLLGGVAGGALVTSLASVGRGRESLDGAPEPRPTTDLQAIASAAEQARERTHMLDQELRQLREHQTDLAQRVDRLIAPGTRGIGVPASDGFGGPEVGGARPDPTTGASVLEQVARAVGGEDPKARKLILRSTALIAWGEPLASKFPQLSDVKLAALLGRLARAELADHARLAAYQQRQSAGGMDERQSLAEWTALREQSAREVAEAVSAFCEQDIDSSLRAQFLALPVGVRPWATLQESRTPR